MRPKVSTVRCIKTIGSGRLSLVLKHHSLFSLSGYTDIGSYLDADCLPTYVQTDRNGFMHGTRSPPSTGSDASLTRTSLRLTQISVLVPFKLPRKLCVSVFSLISCFYFSFPFDSNIFFQKNLYRDTVLNMLSVGHLFCYVHPFQSCVENKTNSAATMMTFMDL